MDRGRFDVSVMAILKNEAPNMEEWLCHHMAIGVDHFFLYDNGSTDELHEVLKPYADHGVVTTVYFPMRGLQRDANNHVVRFFGDTTEWIAYVDIDEFLVPRARRVHQRRSWLAIPMPSRCSSRARSSATRATARPAEGLVTENYREYSEQVPRMGTSEVLAKPIIRPRGMARVGIHNAVTVHGRTVNTAGEPTSEEATVIEDPSYANLQMNHYFTKSWEEFQAKRTRATTSTHAFQLPDVPFDIPGRVDHVIDRWQPRTRALMEEMQTLARSPVALRQQAAPDRASPSATCSARRPRPSSRNEAAGLTEARKKRSFRCAAHARRPRRHGSRRGSRLRAARRALPGVRRTSPRRWPGCEAEVTWAVGRRRAAARGRGRQRSRPAEVPRGALRRPAAARCSSRPAAPSCAATRSSTCCASMVDAGSPSGRAGRA